MTPLNTADDLGSLFTERFTAWLMGLVCFCIIAVDSVLVESARRLTSRG